MFVSLLAVIFAGMAVVMAHRANKHQVKQIEQLYDEEIRRQASKISCWWGTGSKEAGPWLCNISGLPVFSVKMEASSVLGNRKYTLEVLPPTDTPMIYMAVYELTRQGSFDHGSPFSLRIGVTMEFTDANGRGWKRDIDGNLKLLGDRRRSAITEKRLEQAEEFRAKGRLTARGSQSEGSIGSDEQLPRKSPPSPQE